MATRFINKGVSIPDGVGHADGFAANENGALGWKRLVSGTQASSPVLCPRAVVLSTAGGTRTALPSESGTTFIFASACSASTFTLTLPAATKGPMYFRVVLATAQSAIKTINVGGGAVSGMITVTAGSTISSGTSSTATNDTIELVSDGTAYVCPFEAGQWVAAA